MPGAVPGRIVGHSETTDQPLVTAVGSLPIRIGKQFGRYRKLGKTHQNVLVFYNGEPKAIPDVRGECEFGEIEQEGDDG